MREAEPRVKRRTKGGGDKSLRQEAYKRRRGELEEEERPPLRSRKERVSDLDEDDEESEEEEEEYSEGEEADGWKVVRSKREQRRRQQRRVRIRDKSASVIREEGVAQEDETKRRRRQRTTDDGGEPRQHRGERRRGGLRRDENMSRGGQRRSPQRYDRANRRELDDEPTSFFRRVNGRWILVGDPDGDSGRDSDPDDPWKDYFSSSRRSYEQPSWGSYSLSRPRTWATTRPARPFMRSPSRPAFRSPPRFIHESHPRGYYRSPSRGYSRPRDYVNRETRSQSRWQNDKFERVQQEKRETQYPGYNAWWSNKDRGYSRSMARSMTHDPGDNRKRRQRVILKPRRGEEAWRNRSRSRRPKRDEELDCDPYRCFFDHVPWKVTEPELTLEFGKCGVVRSLEIWRRPDGMSSGKGSCLFKTYSAARRAMSQLSGRYIHGRSMYVSSYSPSVLSPLKKRVLAGEDEEWQKEEEEANTMPSTVHRVLFSNAALQTSEGFLRAQFETAGHVLTFGLLRRADGSSLAKGRAEFVSEASAKRVIERFNDKLVDGNRLVVVMDKVDPDESPQARVFFHNVLWSVTNMELKPKFENIGPLRRFELRIKHDGRSLGMGWCEYMKVDDAKVAVEKMNGSLVCGRSLFVSAYDPYNARKAFERDMQRNGRNVAALMDVKRDAALMDVKKDVEMKEDVKKDVEMKDAKTDAEVKDETERARQQRAKVDLSVPAVAA